jgi:peptidyl-tRNA hydrolase, PTH1 family
MKVIVGLGNPGAQYQMNRHNIGFMAIDVLADAYSFRSFKSAYQGHLSEGKIEGEQVLLFKPLTYMNLSGQPVGALCRFYKIQPDNVIVIHDDLDVLPGACKVKQGGGNGGHNGLKSLDQHFGQNYWRLRLGIGHPGDRNLVSNYVLGNFKSSDEDWLVPVLQGITKNMPQLIKGQPQIFLNELALDLRAQLKP